MNQDVNIVRWFQAALYDLSEIEVPDDSIALEAVVLYQDELDLQPYPQEIKHTLPDPLLLEFVTYEYQSNHWMGMITKSEHGKVSYCARLFKNDEVIRTWVYSN